MSNPLPAAGLTPGEPKRPQKYPHNRLDWYYVPSVEQGDDGCAGYLHSDGEFRSGTVNGVGLDTGWFPTRARALAAIERWRARNEKGKTSE